MNQKNLIDILSSPEEFDSHLLEHLNLGLLEVLKEQTIDLEIVKKLLESGANPNCRNEQGQHSLLLALSDKRDLKSDTSKELLWAEPLELVKILLHTGASLHFKDKQGNTPLKLAYQNGFYATASMLIDAGAKNIAIETTIEQWEMAKTENLDVEEYFDLHLVVKENKPLAKIKSPRWEVMLNQIENSFEANMVLFLGELLCLFRNTTRWNFDCISFVNEEVTNFQNTWEITCGKYRVYRSIQQSLDDSTENITEISGFAKGKGFDWNGHCEETLIPEITIKQIDKTMETRIIALAEELFSKYSYLKKHFKVKIIQETKGGAAPLPLREMNPRKIKIEIV